MPRKTPPGSQEPSAPSTNRLEEIVVTATKRETNTDRMTGLIQNQEDAPACDVCGAITVRNGNCYKCLNCGNSMGCS